MKRISNSRFSLSTTASDIVNITTFNGLPDRWDLNQAVALEQDEHDKTDLSTRYLLVLKTVQFRTLNPVDPMDPTVRLLMIKKNALGVFTTTEVPIIPGGGLCGGLSFDSKIGNGTTGCSTGAPRWNGNEGFRTKKALSQNEILELLKGAGIVLDAPLPPPPAFEVPAKLELQKH